MACKSLNGPFLLRLEDRESVDSRCIVSFLLPVTLEGEKCTLLSALGMQEGNAHKSSYSLPFSVLCQISDNNNTLDFFLGSLSRVEYHYRYSVFESFEDNAA